MAFPLAPHIASELWERLGHHDPVDDTASRWRTQRRWRRRRSSSPSRWTAGRAGRLPWTGTRTRPRHGGGLRLEVVARLVAGRELARVVFVPGKILNVVTRARG